MSPAVRRSPEALVVTALLLAFATAASLLLPWVHVGGATRSSISLIGSAGALDVIEGGVKVLVIVGWLLIPVIVATAMILAAAGRLRVSAALVAPLGPLLAGVVVLIGVFGGDVVAWGAYLTAVLAMGASVVATLALRRHAT